MPTLLRLATPAVASGERIDFRIEGRVTGRLDANAEPLVVRVRSLKTGSVVYITRSRWLSVELGQLGPFAVDVSLQANLPAGNYLIEAAAQDTLLHRDFASAPSALIRVTDPGTFRGSVQLNATMQVVSREAPRILTGA